jgi:hypothetical protein
MRRHDAQAQSGSNHPASTLGFIAVGLAARDKLPTAYYRRHFRRHFVSDGDL